MASESGFSNQKKLGTAQFKTIHSIGGDKYGQSVASKALYEKTIEAVITVTEVLGSTGQVELLNVEYPSHGASENDVLRISQGMAKAYFEFDILSVIDGDNFRILPIVLASEISGSDASIMAWVTNKANSDGSQIVTLDPVPLQFIKDSATINVNQDTVTLANTIALPSGVFIYKDGNQIPVTKDTSNPSNTVGMPVEIVAASGTPINITAGDINIQTTDMGASFDSMRIGDGSGNYLSLNAFGETLVKDQDALVELQAISAIDFSTAAKQDLLLAELQLKADLTQTQPVSLASVPLATGAATTTLQGAGNTSLSSIDTKLSSQATAANQTAQSTLFGAVTETAPASDTASSGLNGRLQRIAQRLTSLIGLLPASLGAKVTTASLSVTLASDQAALPKPILNGTITATSKTVGTGPVRATVSGSAPNAARKKLIIKPDKTNTGAIYLGSGSVAVGAGIEIIGPDRLEFCFDASDYYLTSDTPLQSVEILEIV